MPPKRARPASDKPAEPSKSKAPKALAEATKDPDAETENDAVASSAFASRYLSQPLKKDEFPHHEMPANVAYQIIKDARQLDSNPRLNLASFVTTWMEPEAEKLMAEAANVNFVDMEQYPSSTDIQNRCVAMLADLYHAPGRGMANSCGTAAIGSSEAIMLAGLAMKKRWEERRKAEGKSIANPNLVMGYNVQVCWEKLCRYFDIEENFVHLGKDETITDPVKAISQCNENTIGVVAILGSTYTGEYEDVKGFATELEKLNKKHSWDLGIHVDGASGAFVAPFVDQELEWDFRLPQVHSINASGHKYGLVYPGIGWTIWRSKEYLPEAMIFHTNYLGSDQPNVGINFSKSASTIIAQYYQFIRLGFNGYRKIMLNLRAVAKRMETQLLETGHFKILSQVKQVPLVAFALNDTISKDGKHHKRSYNEFDLADRLRSRGWVLPAYRMAPDAQEISLMRATLREDMSLQMVDELVADIKRSTDWLDTHYVFTKTEMTALNSRFHVQDFEIGDEREKHKPGVC